MSRAASRRPPVSGTSRRLLPGLALSVALLAMAACSAGPFGGTSDEAVGPSGPAANGQTSLATQQACRQRINEMYEVRDRGAIYTPNSSINTPFSANYQPDVPSRGLSNQFAYDQNVAECEHNSETGANSTAIPPAPPAAKGR